MSIAGFRLKNYVQQRLCEIIEIFDFSLLHPTREMQKLALTETVEYIHRHMNTAIARYTARQVLDISIRHVKIEGFILEFGVYRGGSIRYISSKFPKRQIHGFDNFEGLPEAWGRADKSTFSMGGKLPRVPRNVVLHKGCFEELLPVWLEKNPGPVAFIHIDCDLYTSTKCILSLIAGRVAPGTIMVFDEYFGYPHWQHHEFKAFQEFVEHHNVQYEYLSYGKLQTSLIILAIGREVTSSPVQNA